MLTSNEDPLSSVPAQGPFILGNVQPEVFLAVIEFLYTNSVTLNSHTVSGDGGMHGEINGWRGALLLQGMDGHLCSEYVEPQHSTVRCQVYHVPQVAWDNHECGTGISERGSSVFVLSCSSSSPIHS